MEAANGVLKEFGERFQTEWLAVFRRKIGLFSETEGDGELIQALLSAMQEGEADFTLAFRRLAGAAEGEDEAFLACFAAIPKASDWLSAWRERLAGEMKEGSERASTLRAANPALIPRNHRVEEALSAANYGDFSYFERLLAAIEHPFEERPEFADLTTPPKPEERVTQTFCGT